MSNLTHQSARHLALMAILVAPLVISAPRARATQPTPAQSQSAPAIKVAVTEQDHLDKAAEYRKKAAAYHAEADMHRKMILDLKKKLPLDTRPGNYESPEVQKMRAHCDAYIKDAERLAATAEKFAEYHEMRAAELKGK